MHRDLNDTSNSSLYPDGKPKQHSEFDRPVVVVDGGAHEQQHEGGDGGVLDSLFSSKSRVLVLLIVVAHGRTHTNGFVKPGSGGLGHLHIAFNVTCCRKFNPRPTWQIIHIIILKIEYNLLSIYININLLVLYPGFTDE